MSTMFDDVEVRCPFFRSSGKRKITCEGITDDCTTTLNFSSHEKRDIQCRVFCDDKYEYCEIYRMLREKYEDD
jgi:hypothetical protein